MLFLQPMVVVLLLLMFLWLVLVGWLVVVGGDLNVVIGELMFQLMMIFLSKLVLVLLLMVFMLMRCLQKFPNEKKLNPSISQKFGLVKFPHQCPLKYCLQYYHTKKEPLHSRELILSFQNF